MAFPGTTWLYLRSMGRSDSPPHTHTQRKQTKKEVNNMTRQRFSQDRINGAGSLRTLTNPIAPGTVVNGALHHITTGDGGDATSYGNNSGAYGGDGGDFNVTGGVQHGNIHHITTGDGGTATSHGNNSPAVGGDGGDFNVKR